MNVQNALAIGSEQSRQFSAWLSSEFHKSIKKKVKTMELLKKGVTVKGKAIYDVVTLFSRLLLVGQQRSVDIADVFQFELSPVPPALALAHYPPVSKNIVLFDRYDQEAPSAKDHEWTRRGRAKEVHLTPSFHAEKLFFTIPRTRISLTTFYAAIPFHTTSNSATCWTVSLLMRRQTSPSAATC